MFAQDFFWPILAQMRLGFCKGKFFMWGQILETCSKDLAHHQAHIWSKNTNKNHVVWVLTNMQSSLESNVVVIWGNVEQSHEFVEEGLNIAQAH